MSTFELTCPRLDFVMFQAMAHLFITKGGADSVFRLLGETHDVAVLATLSQCLLQIVGGDDKHVRMLLEKGLLSFVALLADTGDLLIQHTCSKILAKLTSPRPKAISSAESRCGAASRPQTREMDNMPGSNDVRQSLYGADSYSANDNVISRPVTTSPNELDLSRPSSSSTFQQASKRSSRDNDQIALNALVPKLQDIDDLVVLGGILPLAAVLIANTSIHGQFVS